MLISDAHMEECVSDGCSYCLCFVLAGVSARFTKGPQTTRPTTLTDTIMMA
eukprot:COSAG06_NODE_60919_length_269_cov_0.829412_1_plen_50_part_01